MNSNSHSIIAYYKKNYRKFKKQKASEWLHSSEDCNKQCIQPINGSSQYIQLKKSQHTMYIFQNMHTIYNALNALTYLFNTFFSSGNMGSSSCSETFLMFMASIEPHL